MCDCKETVKNSVVEVAAVNGITEVKIWEGELNRPFEYRGFTFDIQTIESLAEFVRAKGDTITTAILCNEKGIEVILNNYLTDRPKDWLYLNYYKSDAVKDWGGITSNKINQKSFVDFLRKRDIEELPNRDDLLAQIQYLKIATNIVGDFQYDDNNNISIAFKVQDVEKTAKIPREIVIFVPILECLEDVRYPVTVELELIKPTNENEKPTFNLSFFDLDKVYKQATKDAMKKLKELLPGFLILAGKNGR